MNMPKVSVIVPCYNHEAYVEQAILSVLNQSYKNIELIVIDDGSKDNSCSTIRSLSDKHGFTFVEQSNAGVCKTLNRGVSEFSTGDYIALLASDDYWALDKIEKQMKLILSSDNAEFCYTQALEFDSDSAENMRVFPKNPKVGRVLNSVFVSQHVPAGSILFSSRLFHEMNGFDESLKEEDWDFVIRAASLTNFVAVPEPLFYYRSHRGNTMKTRSRRSIFHDKAKILAKNYMLVSPLIWLFSVVLHFTYDHLIYYYKSR
ncbi:glycosyltransferase family 2 protein [Thalassolituus hydrocarboniclasticus]|uniref:Glycosyltransferase n=1 Tax=Thalassolituus hydrocarboniclasticus TaxID=2742796 RepID=A0ABY6AAC0_9GAMM|nr:glycosyltransferase [Thalassolituus hydrocarboniclasticus]UXD87946.1 glycosyltransferase [Thalassolituus hydrocarboniclasticus]